MVAVKIQIIKENAIIPKLAHEGDAGVDLYSTEDYELSPGARTLVSTGIKISLPDGYEAQIRPKSGLALKNGISVLNTPGTIDSGYRGEVGVIAVNFGQETYKIEKGQKIAQMVINRIERPEFRLVDELEKSKRNEGGFGSTGKR